MDGVEDYSLTSFSSVVPTVVERSVTVVLYAGLAWRFLFTLTILGNSHVCMKYQLRCQPVSPAYANLAVGSCDKLPVLLCNSVNATFVNSESL